MSERAPTQQPEKLLASPQPEKLLQAHNETTPAMLAQERQQNQERLVTGRQTAQEQAPQHNPFEQLQAAETAATPLNSYGIMSGELRRAAMRRGLQHVQRRLSPPQRAFSRVIHQPVVRVASELTDKTLSRPSGLLGGGLLAFLGTSVYLYLAKHIGFTYNYGVFLVLFAGGFALGLGLELLVHVATRSQRHPEF